MIEHNWTVASEPAELKRVVESILKCVGDRLKQKGNPAYAERLIEDVRWSIGEVLEDHMIHGNEREAERTITVKMTLNEYDELKIESEDQGEGFDPEAVPDCRDQDRLDLPNGRGLYVTHIFLGKYGGTLQHLGKGNRSRIFLTLRAPSEEAVQSA